MREINMPKELENIDLNIEFGCHCVNFTVV
jgi:hypothetical protein